MPRRSTSRNATPDRRPRPTIHSWRADPRALVLLAVSATVVFVVLWQAPIPQDPRYHRFVDQRVLLGLPNALNVLSNIAFFLVGLVGLAVLWPLRQQRTVQVWTPYGVVFAGAVLTSLGSGWYHWQPSNDSLLWDRLPMTLIFMGLFCSVLGEQVSHRLADRLLAPLLAVGIGSVLCWIHTEHLGHGDLRPYALVQFLPVLLIPLLLALYPRPRQYLPGMVALMGLYVLSKVFEFADEAIFSLGQVVSGHTLKHLASAMALASLLPMLHTRRRRTAATVRIGYD